MEVGVMLQDAIFFWNFYSVWNEFWLLRPMINQSVCVLEWQNHILYMFRYKID